MPKICLRNKVKPEKRAFAKYLRKYPTRSESQLWKSLCKKQLGVKFRRQAIILGWIVDFWCPNYKLVIELDGIFHCDRLNYDQKRDVILLRKCGIKTLRFPSSWVFTNKEAILFTIKNFVKVEGEGGRC